MNKPVEYQLVILSPGGCRMCGESSLTPQRVTIESIEQQDGVSWKLSGTGRVTSTCPMCAEMYNVIRTTIPIECASYACPDCGGKQNLKYNIQKIEARGSEFNFWAEITCSKCHKKKSLVETLKDFLGIKKLEVKLTGICIER